MLTGIGCVFSCISLLLPKEYGALTLAAGTERHFNEFTSGCTRFFNRLKISNLQIILHIWLVSKEGGCAVRFVTIWFTMMFFFPVHHEVNSLKAGRNENV